MTSELEKQIKNLNKNFLHNKIDVLRKTNTYMLNEQENNIYTTIFFALYYLIILFLSLYILLLIVQKLILRKINFIFSCFKTIKY